MFQLSCTGSEHSGINAGGEQLQGQAAVDTDNIQPDNPEGLTPGDIARSVSTFDETEEWDIVSFTDPRDSSVYDIVDQRVIIAFKDPPDLPEEDPDYFEDELASNDTYYTSVTYSMPSADQDIADFIEDEELDVYSEWPEVNALAAILPDGQTVSDAVANWPTEYSDIIDVVDPDAVVDTLFGTPPNDGMYNDSWHLRSASSHDVNIEPAWNEDPQSGLGNSSVVVAILDTGVQHGHDDLIANSTPKGCNTGDSLSSTTYLSRSSGGGEPYTWLLNRNAGYAEGMGHGTCVAGLISASIDNDPSSEEEKSAVGIAANPKYFPVAMKMIDDGESFSTGAILNAYQAVGAVLGVYNKHSLYSATKAATVPHYYIRVVNCSFAGPSNTTASRHIDNLGRYVLFVCGAGNEGENGSLFPASHSLTMSVAAFYENGLRHSDSNYGSDVDIASPGYGLHTCDMYGTNIWGHRLGYSNDAVVSSFGWTSGATANVSAVAALVYSEYPYWFGSQCRSRITSTEDLLPYDSGTGSLQYVGKVDAYEAIQ